MNSVMQMADRQSDTVNKDELGSWFYRCFGGWLYIVRVGAAICQCGESPRARVHHIQQSRSATNSDRGDIHKWLEGDPPKMEC